MSSARVVTDDTFEAEVLARTGPVIVEYWAEWCGPCRMVAPVLESIAADYAGKVDLVKVNVDENPAIARRYGILHVPTISVFAGGEVVKQVIGARSKSALLREFGDLLEPSAVYLGGRPARKAARPAAAGMEAGLVAPEHHQRGFHEDHRLERARADGSCRSRPDVRYRNSAYVCGGASGSTR